MAKRKKSIKNESKKANQFRSSGGFWSNAGTVPVAAINPDRPFDFQTGTLEPSHPLKYGSVQYVVTEFSVPDTWIDADCFKLNSAHLFQAIRENLRSNLAYSEIELRAYLANVMWLQACFSTLRRDFSFVYFRDPQHPSFDKIWGRTISDLPFKPIDPDAPDVYVAQPEKKTYMAVEEYASNLTSLETILIPASKGIILPPAMSEYMKWMFDMVFTDEMDVSRGQYYWNELRSIPQYDIVLNNNVPELQVTARIDMATITIEGLANICIDLASKYGVIIADLKRCGAQMVVPDISIESIKSPSMKYDEMYFTALENAYVMIPIQKSGSFIIPSSLRFFNIDIIPGMNDAQIASSLSFLGTIDSDNDSISIPLKPTRQYALVSTDTTATFLTDPYVLDNTGRAFYPAPYDAGVYAFVYGSRSGGYKISDSSGPVVPTTTLNSSGTYFFGNGYVSGTAEVTPGSRDLGSMHTVSIPIGEGKIGSYYYGLYITAESPAVTLRKDEWDVTVRIGAGFSKKMKAYAYHGNGVITGKAVRRWDIGFTARNVLIPAFIVGSESDYLVSNVAVSSQGVDVAVDYVITFIPVDINKYRMEYTYSLGTSSPGFTTTTSMSDVHGYGTESIGTQDASLTVWNTDPSVSLKKFLLQEVEHHLPSWDQEVVYDADNAVVTSVASPVLLKKTRSTTLYNTTELNTYLYQLYYSLMYVHAKPVERAIKKA